jgi:hypothetical protein
VTAGGRTWGAAAEDRGTWTCDGPSWEESQLLHLKFSDAVGAGAEGCAGRDGSRDEDVMRDAVRDVVRVRPGGMAAGRRAAVEAL